ncbi:MAG: dihydropteroate synthase [Angustibacter sp.]
MGVLNVTPDSFSDGGRWLDPGLAVTHGQRMHAAGADLVDVGGESTRPGARRVPEQEEAQRVLPVIRGLVDAGVPVSIDTMRSVVAAAALRAGAAVVNDVSGGLDDHRMVDVVADAGVPYVVMHWRGPATPTDQGADYADVVADVRRELDARLSALVDAGLDQRQVVVDPGLGFAKRPEHNWRLLAELAQLTGPGGVGRPVLIGASRKRFLGLLPTGDARSGTAERSTDQRDDATAATTVVAALAGAWAVRVHDVAANVDAVRVVAAVRSATQTASAGAVPAVGDAGALPVTSGRAAPEGKASRQGASRPHRAGAQHRGGDQ